MKEINGAIEGEKEERRQGWSEGWKDRKLEVTSKEVQLLSNSYKLRIGAWTENRMCEHAAAI